MECIYASGQSIWTLFVASLQVETGRCPRYADTDDLVRCWRMMSRKVCWRTGGNEIEGVSNASIVKQSMNGS